MVSLLYLQVLSLPHSADKTEGLHWVPSGCTAWDRASHLTLFPKMLLSTWERNRARFNSVFTLFFGLKLQQCQYTHIKECRSLLFSPVALPVSAVISFTQPSQAAAPVNELLSMRQSEAGVAMFVNWAEKKKGGHFLNALSKHLQCWGAQEGRGGGWGERKWLKMNLQTPPQWSDHFSHLTVSRRTRHSQQSVQETVRQKV